MRLSIIGVFLLIATSFQLLALYALYHYTEKTELLLIIGDSKFNLFIYYVTGFADLVSLVAAGLALYNALFCDLNAAWSLFVLHCAVVAWYGYVTYYFYSLDKEIFFKGWSEERIVDYSTVLLYLLAACFLISVLCGGISLAIASRLQWCDDGLVTIRVPRCNTKPIPKCCMPGHIQRVDLSNRPSFFK